MAFAAACRWLRELKYISKSEWHDDALWFHFQDFNEKGTNLQLKQFTEAQMNDIKNRGGMMRDYAKTITPTGLDPLIPHENVDYRNFKSDGKYDYMFLKQSPGFTPKASDTLIPVIQSYMELNHE
ncbi:MAG: hypothetical protein ACXVMS_01290 [Flavisolibacter sp.]